MRWPWKREHRASTDAYSDLVVAGLLARAEGGAADPAELAVAGAVSHIFATALTLAAIGPAGSMASRLLTAPMRAYVGTQLVLTGNALLLMESGDDGVSLIPCTGAADGGDSRPETWLYTVTTSGPGYSANRRVMGGSLLHFRMSTRPGAPWRGVSPLERAGLDAAALAAITGQLAAAGKAAHGWILNTGNYGDETAVKNFRESLGKLRGGIATYGRGNLDERGGAGLSGVGLLHLKIDQGLTLMRRDLVDGVASACGIPPQLLSSTSGGTGPREGWRQAGVMFHGLGKVLAEEIAVKLGESVELDFAELASADFRMRASGFKALVDAGMDPANAALLAGLDATARE